MISIVVTWRDRAQLKEALPFLVREAASVAGEIVVVNYGGSTSLLHSLLPKPPSGFRIVSTKQRKYFNKSAAQNIGARTAEKPMLFFCDCDVCPEAGAVAALKELIERNEQNFGTLRGVKESMPNSRQARHIVRFGYELRLRAADGRELKIVDHEEDAETGLRQAPGLLMVRRTHFEQIGGYNSDLLGWGWEDQDMISRLTLGLGLTRVMHGAAIHLSHGDQERVGFYPVQDRWESRDRMFRTALRNYDAANFQGTYLADGAREMSDLSD